MKQKLRLFSTLLLLAVASMAWGKQTTVTASKVASSSASWTGSGGETWSVAVTGGATNQNLIEGYAQVGTKSSPSTSITFSTSGISGTITSVVIDCASYSGKATVSCTIGGTAFGTQSQSTPSWSNSSGGEVTFEGNASGSIVLTMTNGDGGRAMYVKSITVVYEENTSGKTTATLTFEDLPEGEVLVGHEFDIKVSTNSDAEIKYQNLTAVFSVKSFDQETGVATIRNLSEGPGRIKFYVEETDYYTAAERTLTFTSRKDNTSIVFDDSQITNTDISKGMEAGKLIAKMIRESDGQLWVSSESNYSSFTFASLDENVATIAADGTITLKGAGTVSLTAKYNGSDFFAESPVATYELTVTNSDGPVIRTATFDFVNDITDISSPITREEFTSTFDKGSGTTNPTYNTNSKEARLYAKGTLTISAPIGKTISKIVYNYVVNPNKNGAVPTVESVKGDTEDGTWNGDGKTWTGSANTVTMTLGGSAGNFGFKTITVTYEEADQTISVAPQISGEESFLNETTVTITAAEGAAIYYTIDGTDPTTSSTQYSAPFTLDATTTVKAIAVESGKTPSEVAKKTFTKQTVMTVAEALTLIEGLEENESSDFVYVKGVVTQVESYSDKYNSITYSIADVGTTTPELKVYGGKNLNNTDFSSMDDLGVNDVVTIYGKLKVYNSTPEFDSNNYIVAIERSKQPAGLSYATTTITKQVGDEPFTNKLTNPHSLAVTYSSNDEAVATVDADGVVTILAAGSAIITASFGGNDTYNEGSASYSLTVSNGEKAVFKKVTSTDDITDGEYLIVYEEGTLAFDGSLATLDAVGNTQEVTISDATIETSTAYAFTISSITGGYSIKSASGKYIGQESDANGMATKDDAIANTISFDEDGNANIVSCGAYLRYNAASNQTRFRYYKSASYNNQKAIQLYKKVETVTASITAAGYATFANAKAVDFTGTGVKVMTAQYANGKISYTEVTSKQVPAGAAVILQGNKGTYNATVIESAAALENNNLQVDLEKNQTSDGTYYCLANKSNGVGFYKVAKDTIVKQGKAYLKIPAEAKDFFSINDETDGIGQIEMGQTSNAEIYNLSGQRVNKAQKGIYIVNGKKVVIK